MSLSNKDYALAVVSGELEDIDYNKISTILVECNDLYHNSDDGTSYLTDSEYDALELVYKTYSDNIPVGSPVRTGKVDLPTVMGSLDQVYENDTTKWVNEYKLSNEDIVIGDKQDGVSGSTTYVDGKLRISYSRGDGYQGADVTRHLLLIKNSVKEIDHKGILEVRYEVILDKDAFEKYKNDLIKNNHHKIPKNPRNYVAGQMNAETAEQWFYDNALVIVTSLQDDHYNLDKSKEYEYLKKLGFNITPFSVNKGSELTDAFLTKFLETRRKESITEIDGIVLDVDNKNIRKNMKWKDNKINPPYSKKYKIASEDNFAESKVVKVHWRPSKTGYIKPRVEIEPVDLVGVTITYATGFNAKFIVENNIGPGAIVKITRAGDVIPHIISVSKAGKLEMPDYDFEWNETEVDIMVTDDNNKEVIINRLTNIFSELKVPMLKKASIVKLVDAGIDTAPKIIKLDLNKFKEIIGDSSGEKIYNGIKDKLNPIKLSVLAGVSNLLGRGVGVRMMTALAKELGEKAILNPNLTVNTIENVKDFGEKTAILIKSNQKKFLNFLEEIDGYYTLDEKIDKPSSTTLSGVMVCFTGVRSAELEKTIKDNGGEVIGSIKKDPQMFLVCKDKTKKSSKLDKAKSLLDVSNILTLEEAMEKWK